MENKENVLSETEKEELIQEIINNEIAKDVGDSDIEDVIHAFENDPDVLRLKAQEAELMRLVSDPKVMKSYKDASRRVLGVGERRPLSKKEIKKKKAKRRMSKKSKRK